MYYRGYLPPIECPRCATLNNRVREECRYCGCPLENRCSNENCGETNVEKAHFCSKCGKPTLYNLFNVFDDDTRSFFTAEAESYYHLYGDPDIPEAKAEQTGRSHNFLTEPFQKSFDDLPDLPLDPEDIPYY